MVVKGAILEGDLHMDNYAESAIGRWPNKL